MSRLRGSIGILLAAVLSPGPSARADTLWPASFAPSTGVAFVVALSNHPEVGVHMEIGLGMAWQVNSCDHYTSGQLGVVGSATFLHRSGWRIGATARFEPLLAQAGGGPEGGVGVGFFREFARGTYPSRLGLRIETTMGLALVPRGQLGLQIPLLLDLPIDGGSMDLSLVLGAGLRAPTVEGAPPPTPCPIVAG